MNVIVVVCNSLHLGFLGAYGNAWIETPHLDRLAAEGVVFDHHFPENLTTLPTRRSWWTGRYGFPDPEQGWTPLRPDEVILPDLLWDQGVRTALISDVPLLREAGLGYGRGFDEVIWIRGQGYDPLFPPATPGPGRSSCETSRACGCPRGRPEPGALEEALGAVPPEPGRAADRRRGEHGSRAGRCGRRSTGWSVEAAGPTRSCSGSTCSARTARGTRPSPIATSTPPSSPTSSRRARRGTWSRTGGRRGDRPRGRARPDRRARRRRRRRARRGRAVPPAPDLRRDRHPGRPLARRAVRGPAAAGTDGRHPARLHERPGRAAGRARLSCAGSAPGSTRS